ncbi:hypothetical protein [uncultured Thiodictyon sp.]|uniref:hypothetical protein n=1 Tax=uncultured Thiodictyon sp. TaxID=1846217 RepID=UPI0025FB04AB|nr:hypothetical protein [uncultured Thiodictyon sp.]
MTTAPTPTRVLAILAALLLGGCATAPPSTEATLLQINAAVNRQGVRCPRDSCQEDWPDPADLDRLKYWDCKAYAVAKADRLIRQYGYSPERLEYLLIAGPPLRVTHAALLVDGRWVMDLGLRCQVCELERFVDRATITGRLPVSELPLVMGVLAR